MATGLLGIWFCSCHQEPSQTPVLSQQRDETRVIERARNFLESQVETPTLPNIYFSSDSQFHTRADQTQNILNDAIELDWSRAWSWENDRVVVTEVPAQLTRSIEYIVLIEQLGDTISLTKQLPHTRIIINERKDNGYVYFFLATLLPDESYDGDLSQLSFDPVGSDYCGISIYSYPNGTPCWGLIYDAGSMLSTLLFDEPSPYEYDSELRIAMGIQFESATRGIFEDNVIETIQVVASPPPAEIDWSRGGNDSGSYGGGGGGSGSGSNGTGNDGSGDGSGRPNPNGYRVMVSANPPNGGKALGSGKFYSSFSLLTATISATAYLGFEFVNWTGSATSSSRTYTFPVFEDMTFVANFRPCFDDNTANPLSSMALAPPVTNGVTNIAGATYGNTRNGGAKKHNGIDLAGPVGTPIYAQFSGIVSAFPAIVSGQPNRIVENGIQRYPSSYTGTDRDGGGNRIYIDSSVGGKTVKNGYMHLQAGTPFGTNPRTGQPWKAGDIINAGEVIGYIGVTGNANPNVPHLHLRTLVNGVEVNPASYLNATVSTTTSKITTPCH